MKGIKRVMIIGSGPIVIGQAAEFDYAGTQACRALKAAGLEVILVNPNPATIMTDSAIADRIYIEPLSLEVLRRIIIKEQPDSLLSTLGGQSGLTLSMQLAKEGFLAQHNVRLLGAKRETIDKAEDRLLFKQTMESIGEPCIPSDVVTDVDAALAFAQTIGYPVIVRPAFTLGGSGGGIADTPEQLHEIARAGIHASPIGQILVERCIAGWKEIEFEVIRDGKGNVITVCSMENMDPVGVHTGDSIVVAPAVTLADKEYQMLRTAACNIVSALEVEGGCNVQFALEPHSFEYAVIEVNPRVSRSSALASKATGYPIAKVASQIAVGFTLDEIVNAVTGKTCACFEPAIDYVVVKLPKWPFDKFVYAKRTLGTQMKATGEVMSIATTFEAALMKAVRGAEIGLDTLCMPKMAALSDETLRQALHPCTDERLFALYEALLRGITPEEIHAITQVDLWFLYKMQHIASVQRALETRTLDDALYRQAKEVGFTDGAITRISGQKIAHPLRAAYKMVDTCAAEFAAQTPYFYATFDEENEAAAFIAQNGSGKKRVIVFGSGPIRIGQGIEFDYASVHCVWTLKEAGYEVVMVNNNPETVSTDFDTADRLYFEPLTPEDVMQVIHTEQPYGVVVAFGGQTAIKLTRALQNAGVRILGTPADSIDAAEDRARFDAILNKLGIPRPEGDTVMTTDEALAAAHRLGYPVLMRPSYVLGGQNMIIAFSDEDIKEYMSIILTHNIENPVLIDKYMMGVEVEVDAICDGEDVLIPGIMEHIERAGVHSGDSIAVYPAWNLNGAVTQRLIDCTRALALALDTRGLINIQYVIYENEVFVIEANPRSSRTVPYISKVTGVPVVDLATRAMLGARIRDMGYGTGLYHQSPYYAVKVPVFSFEKLEDVDTHLGPEMKSTGEVLGVGKTLEEATYKGLVAAGYNMQREGGVYITVRDSDKRETVPIARKFYNLGFKLYATRGTAEALAASGIPAQQVPKLSEDSAGITSLLENGHIHYMISTSSKGRIPTRDSVKLRRLAVTHAIPCLTSLDTANALAGAIASGYTQENVSLVDINHIAKGKTPLRFVKMRASGNDYIYFDCFDQQVEAPESLSVHLSSRRHGIGGDGIVLMYPSDRADVRMRMFNADGSEGEVAGNALRCVAKYLYESGRVPKLAMTMETGGGIKQAQLYVRENNVFSVCMNMGPASFHPEDVPVLLEGDEVVDRSVELAGDTYRVTCLSMGNPHVVIFCDDVDAVDLAMVGPRIERDPLFPRRVNVSFVSCVNSYTLKMRVWERGIGETWACGTGACAAVAAAVRLGYCKKNHDMTVHLRGGDLVIRVAPEGILLTGDAKKDFEGVIEA